MTTYEYKMSIYNRIGQIWTSEEDEMLYKLYHVDKLTIGDICKKHGRTLEAIKCRFIDKGIIKGMNKINAWNKRKIPLPAYFIQIFEDCGFTYIDDIIQGIIKSIENVPSPEDNNITLSKAPHKIYNLGNNNPVTLRDFISAIEKACSKKAKERHLPMQQGDVPITYADIDETKKVLGFNPSTPIETGIKRFVEWYKSQNL